MPYKTKTCKPIRYRVKDVGRKYHHYLLIKVEPKKCQGKKGGTTQAELVSYKKHHKGGESPYKAG